ncbi:hypothetical protein PR048_025172 [Dryococelus australis]|uniref:Helitron helicase-like domain-containing protein n=1 Tax=Dryococelus australis TaxID=614101 RepID=A0ABQ9GQQ7_9NEOP|nr:hypothetical protein PR048_025172 [Dryococelus australis]
MRRRVVSTALLILLEPEPKGGKIGRGGPSEPARLPEDSHSCGPKGTKAKDPNGKACVIECDSIDKLVRICKRATVGWICVKTYLIAENRPDQNPKDLDMIATQLLIERYPVVVSSHFMVRVNALIKYLRNNFEVLGGKLKEFWWRIKFLNRGSPHLHVVVWVENHPSFEIEVGIHQLYQVSHTFEILDQEPLQADLEAEAVEAEQNMSDDQFQTAQRAMNIGQKRGKGNNDVQNKAQDKLTDATRNAKNIDIDTIIPTDINKTGGMPQKLEFFVGAKVMLRSNIDVGKRLVIGAIGHITEIIWPCFRRTQMYETDIPSVRVDFANEGIHFIHPKSVQFRAKFSYGTAERRMLLIVLSWASTVHKIQGSTVDFAVRYLGSKLFAAGQAYVALSRMRSLDGLQIEELDCAKLSGEKPCNTEALVDINRMRNHLITYD